MGTIGRRRGTILSSAFLWMVGFLWIQMVFLAISDKSFAEEEEGARESLAASSGMDKITFDEVAKEIKGGFDYLFKALVFGRVQKPIDSTLNPNNDFLRIPRYSSDLEFRPEFSLEYRGLKMNVKPRLNINWQHWEDGSREGDDETDYDWFVNEWLVSLKLIKELFVSYERENLQWGPSFLISPSNPFFRDNGQSNSKREVPGMDFARLIWMPSSSWTVSFIANVDNGRQEISWYGFEPVYALKLDYTTYRKYISLIVSHQRNNRGSLGAFAGWTVSDALLLHAEGTLSQGTNAMYPVTNPATLLGIQMNPIEEDETSPEGLFLTGGSYTFKFGPTLTLEYLFNSAGYSKKQADLYFELRRRASEAFFSPIQDIRDLSRLTLAQTLDPPVQ